MREILFRAKNLDRKEWVYGDLIHEPWGRVIQHCKLSRKIKDSVFDVTIGQYIGQNDKNGEKIFEGDIVVVDGEGDDEYFEVCYNEETARYEIDGKGLTLDFNNFYSYEIEVIGNIHDNPQLMERNPD